MLFLGDLVCNDMVTIFRPCLLWHNVMVAQSILLKITEKFTNQRLDNENKIQKESKEKVHIAKVNTLPSPQK